MSKFNAFLHPLCCALAALAVTAPMKAVSALPPFDSVVSSEHLPVHRLLLGEPFTDAALTSAGVLQQAITLRQSPAELAPVSYRVPFIWANATLAFNAELVRQNEPQLARIADYLAGVSFTAKDVSAWCAQTTEVVTRLRALGEFSTPQKCMGLVRYGLVVQADAPKLEAVILDSISEAKEDRRLFVSLQYVCRQCKTMGLAKAATRDVLFRVSAVVFLNNGSDARILSLALPVVLQKAR